MRQTVRDYSYKDLRRRQGKIVKVVVFVLAIFVVPSFFLSYVLFSVKVDTSSMSPTISDGGVVFITPLDRSPGRGDIVWLSRMDNERAGVFKRLANSFVRFFTLRKYSPFDSISRMTGAASLRRVVGLPGDSVYIRDFVAHVRPADASHYLTEFELAKKSYNISVFSIPVGWDGIGTAGDTEAFTLGPDEYFVLADNRVEAIDSRMYGAVSRGNIRGRALFQVFPLNEIHRY